MNKLITTHTGGMPDFLDNFRWYENGVNEVLSHIVRGLANGGKALRLFGVTIQQDTGNIQISSGAIYFNNEIFTVPTHTLPKLPTGAPGTYYWDFEESYDPSGLLTFEDSSVVQDCYAIRVAKLKKTSEILDEGTFVPLSIPLFSNVYTLRSDFNALYSNFNNLFASYKKLRAEVGGAYFQSSLNIPSMAWSDIPWSAAFGSIKSPEADITMVNGGVYEINVVKLAGSGQLRLYHDGGPSMDPEVLHLDHELQLGRNIFWLNGYAGSHPIRLQGIMNSGETIVTVRLIALDPNPLEGGIIVAPGEGG